MIVSCNWSLLGHSERNLTLRRRVLLKDFDIILIVIDWFVLILTAAMEKILMELIGVFLNSLDLVLVFQLIFGVEKILAIVPRDQLIDTFDGGSRVLDTNAIFV